MSEDEVLANAFYNTLISIIRPGMRKAVYGTCPNTCRCRREGVGENQQIEQRRDHGGRHSLEAHFDKALQFLLQQVYSFVVARLKSIQLTSSRSARRSSSSSISQPAWHSGDLCSTSLRAPHGQRHPPALLGAQTLGAAPLERAEVQHRRRKPLQ